MKTLLALVIATTAAVAAPAKKGPAATVYNVDSAATKVEWLGKKVAGPHNGNVAVKSGTLAVLPDGSISEGTIVVDMKSITNADVTDKEWNDKLVGHLKGADFFDVEKYPESTLVIKSSKKTKNGVDVTADITIRGITQPVKFTATDVKQTVEGYSAKAEVVINRIKHGVVYNAGKGDANLIKQLGDKLISDDFTLTINLAAKK